MLDDKPISAFVWYHAPAHLEPDFQKWIKQIKQQLNIEATLYQRIENQKTTFMEVFECVDLAMIEKIEQLAAQQAYFFGIERRCESFQRIT